MPAAAQAAANTLFQMGTQGCPQTFSTIANVGDLSGPSMAATVVDVTSHSTGNPWRQMIVTLLSAGEISLPLFFLPNVASGGGHDGTSGLLSVFAGRQLRRFALVFPDAQATTYYFDAYVSKFNFKEPVAGVIAADVTFTITGQPVLV